MWKYILPTQVVFGNEEAKSIGKHMDALNIEKAMIVATPSSVRSGLADSLMSASNGRIVGICSDVEPNPTVQNVDACRDAATKLGARAIVGLGGGSAMDCAKAVAACVAENCYAEDFLMGKAVTKAIPIVCVPTTSGTGSEVTSISVISWHEKYLKQPIKHTSLYPVLSIIDPVLTYNCPPAVTANAGMDVLAHALDSLFSVNHQPASEAMAIRASKLVLENIFAAFEEPDNEMARHAMAEASVLAGMAFTQTGTSGSHACSYELTLKLGVPHGEGCAFTLPSFVRLNADAYPELKDYIEEIGFDDADALADKIDELKRAMGMRMTLRDLGVVEDVDETIKQLAEAAVNQVSAPNNVVKLTADIVEDIYDQLS